MDNKEKFIAYSTFRMVCTFVGGYDIWNDLQKYFKKQRILCDSKIQRCKIETSHPFSITKLYW